MTDWAVSVTVSTKLENIALEGSSRVLWSRTGIYWGQLISLLRVGSRSTPIGGHSVQQVVVLLRPVDTSL